MPKVDVINLDNKVVGSVELSEEVFGAKINQNLLYEAVRWHMAGVRGGNAKTKTRHEVSGSGKKLWRQKGTGRARMGSIRSPLWRHGGTVHGPQPRDYSYALPKKMVKGALRSALSSKLQAGEISVVSDFSLADHKTKNVRAALDRLEANKSVLVVDNSGLRNLTLGTRNLPGVKLVASKDLTTYDLLGHQRVLLSKAAAEKLSEALKA
jgi:large subunit ribosomal protein L4